MGLFGSKMDAEDLLYSAAVSLMDKKPAQWSHTHLAAQQSSKIDFRR